MLDHFVLLFKELWNADERPEARRFTIGCFAIVLIVIAAVALWYANSGP
jgi:hypothetical protein